MKRYFDFRDAAEEKTLWRTMLVFAHTASCSARVLGRGVLSKPSIAGKRLMDFDSGALNRVIDRWVSHVFDVSKTTLEAGGTESVVLGQSYILVSNHRSLLDIPAISATFPGSVRFVAKHELRKIPLFGRAMSKAGNVFVDRKNRAKAIEQLKAAKSLKEGGHSLWVAAEGGRNTTNKLLPLKKGPLHLAVDLQLCLLPVWIDGTDSVIAPTGLGSTTAQTVRVLYGEPIHYDQPIETLREVLRESLLDLKHQLEDALPQRPTGLQTGSQPTTGASEGEQ